MTVDSGIVSIKKDKINIQAKNLSNDIFVIVIAMATLQSGWGGRR